LSIAISRESAFCYFFVFYQCITATIPVGFVFERACDHENAASEKALLDGIARTEESARKNIVSPNPRRDSARTPRLLGLGEERNATTAAVTTAGSVCPGR
jgi:hypothetical protein